MVDTNHENLINTERQDLFQTLNLHPAEPLWKRAPTRNDDGRPFHDFMMLIPGLRQSKKEQLSEVIKKMEEILIRYERFVVFADLNLKINVLWVTVKPQSGICAEIASMIHDSIPEAKLVSQIFD